MTFRNFSKRQMLALCWWNQPQSRDLDGIICDGAVRSGKTMALTCGFFLWSMRSFDGQVFALCGKTVSALRRNLILPLHDWMGGLMQISENRAENKLTVRMGNRVNTYYLFGGQDEGSYMLIQGITLAGVLLDEAVLMPRSFVEQAVARCSVEGAKLWFSCNPGSPEHWFYREWLCKTQQKRLMRLHFTMEDNPALPEAVKERYRRLYTGVFYRRYVLGLWCAAEGRVYDFDPQRHTVEVPQALSGSVTYYISVDYGVHNPFSAGLWAVQENRVKKNLSTNFDGFEAQEKLVKKNLSTNFDGFAAQENHVKKNLSTNFDGFEAQKNLVKKNLSTDFDGFAAQENLVKKNLSTNFDGLVAVRIREFYHDGRASGKLMTDEEYHKALEELAGDLPIRRVIIDPSAASMIALLRKKKVFRVRRADNRVLPGIRLVGSLLQKGQLRIGRNCKDALREFSLYVWQDDAAKDAPAKENDHAMDDIRYFCMSVMRAGSAR